MQQQVGCRFLLCRLCSEEALSLDSRSSIGLEGRGGRRITAAAAAAMKEAVGEGHPLAAAAAGCQKFLGFCRKADLETLLVASGIVIRQPGRQARPTWQELM